MKPTWVEVILLPFDNIDRRNKETASKGLLVKKLPKIPSILCMHFSAKNMESLDR